MALGIAQVAGAKIANNSSITVTLGSAPAAGKKLVAACMANGGTARTFTATGWTSKGRADHTTNSACELFMRDAPGGTAAFSFGLDVSNVNWHAIVWELTDADGTEDVVATNFGSSGDPTVDINPVDATLNKIIILAVGNRANATFTPDASPAMTQDYDDAQTGGTAFSAFGAHSTSTFTSGAIQTIDADSTASASWACVAICIKEVAVPTVDLTGLSAGSSTTSGAILITRHLTGLSAGGSSTTGVLAVLWALAGTSAGSSASDALLRVLWALVGTSAGSSTTSGELTVTPPAGFVDLTGLSAGGSSSSGAIFITRHLSGVSGGSSGGGGELALLIALSGASIGGSSTTAILNLAASIFQTRSNIGGSGTMVRRGSRMAIRSTIGTRRV